MTIAQRAEAAKFTNETPRKAKPPRSERRERRAAQVVREAQPRMTD